MRRSMTRFWPLSLRERVNTDTFDPPVPFGMLLRLESVQQSDVGYSAYWSGKPFVHGNTFGVPISEEAAKVLVPGKQYLFVMVEEQD